VFQTSGRCDGAVGLRLICGVEIESTFGETPFLLSPIIIPKQTTQKNPLEKQNPPEK